jgi:hypothetical protein
MRDHQQNVGFIAFVRLRHLARLLRSGGKQKDEW